MDERAWVALVAGVVALLGLSFGDAGVRRRWGGVARALGRGFLRLADAWAPEPPLVEDYTTRQPPMGER